MSEIEKQFYETFGIEPKYKDACTVEDKYWANEELSNEYGTFSQYMNCKCGDQENCTTECSCTYQKEIYPEITDSILLKLICILAKITDEQCGEPYKVFVYNYEDLKELVLDDCSLYKEQIKQQVQALFKE